MKKLVVNKLMNSQNSALWASIFIGLLLFVIAGVRYTNFFSLPVIMNLVDDNAFLGIAAVGMTFVILSGGIDLSVGAMIGLTSIASALLVEKQGWHPGTAAISLVFFGALFGAFQGFLIARFSIAPFLASLAGLFCLRGLAFTLSLESIALTHPFYSTLSSMTIPMGIASLRLTAMLFIATVAVGFFVARWTRFGRSVYAIGGNAISAELMGLPVRRSTIFVYAISGFCAALAGVAYTLYTSSGNATAATGLELDVIAAVVIGGTLLTGGRGSILGTLVGVLILGTIQTIITFEATLSSWWTRIVIGLLLLFFVTFQKFLTMWADNRFRTPPTTPRTTTTRSSKSEALARTRVEKAVVGITAFFVFASASEVQAANSQAAAADTVIKAQVGRAVIEAAQPSPVLPTAPGCPTGFQRGEQLEKGLYIITGTHLRPGDRQTHSTDLADPTPPYITEKGEVEIYGSSKYFIRFKNWNDFANAGCFERVELDLRLPNGQPYSQLYSQPWDLRKYRVIEAGKKPYEILIGGSMSPTQGRSKVVWPDDNINRRIFFFRKDPKGHWVRDLNPIVGKPENSWIGHSYGGNLLQLGQEPHLIRLDRKNEIAFFFEKVTDDKGNSPYKTEIFAIRMRGLEGSIPSTLKLLFPVTNSSAPSFKRVGGGFLAEGPRPVEMTIQGKHFFIVPFSAGDFPTDFYTINYAWSTSLYGPYHPVMKADGSDLVDLGSDLKARFGLSWVGRPSIYRAPNGKFEMLFHGVRKSIVTDNDYTRWPGELWAFYRSIFKVNLDVSLNANGEPVIVPNTDRRLAP